MKDKKYFQRFLNKIAITDGCWLWTAGTVDGYGVIWDGKKMARANRVSYQFFNGNLDDKKMVLHKCNNRLCVNPAHLVLGTHEDNMRDLARSGVKKGQTSKLTPDQVKKIKTSRDAGVELAKRYGVAPQTICNIKKGRNWSWL